MCGITGFLHFGPGPDRDEAQRRLRAMTDTLAHRGPDADGLFLDPESGVGLGHRRLAIVDLSPQGVQPMESASGRFITVFNGEIYNYQELRAELEAAGQAPVWRGSSDTEVMLALFEACGVGEALARCTGMFALALWDRRERTLFLARDRMGEKPLYYGFGHGPDGPAFLFGSELKSLRPHPALDPAIDRAALAQYLRLHYVPAPRSILKSVRKLPAGTWLAVPASGASRPEPRAYWTLAGAVEAGLSQPFAGSEEEASRDLEQALRRTVRGQMVADVPLGAFLSGGVDSSLVVALMQAESARPVRTFTIGFGEAAYDESREAARVAAHLGTDHTELRARPEDGLAVVEGLADIYDEPFSDASQIPTFLVSRLTREHVTVALSGDGGDEIFAGYNRHFWGAALWGRLGGLPPALRGIGGAALRALSPTAWNRIFGLAGPLLPGRLRQRLPGYKLHKLADLLPAKDRADFYRRMVSNWQRPELVARDRDPGLPDWPEAPANCTGFTAWMQFTDAATYLPDDIMAKVDRASMAVSLETRAPYLDHRVVEAAWRLPLSMKVADGQGKRILRRILDRFVPRELIDRPKMGFGVPIDAWLRGPLREWAEGLLEPGRMERQGFLDPAPVRAAWAEHQSGRADHHYRLWNVLMFQAWLERWG
jgi:asparagine synthase (glutamine-hydrolysing)